MKRCRKEELAGGEPEENARIALEILKGATGPKRDAVILNAGAAIHIASDNLSLEEGVKKAKEMIDSGKALEQLKLFIEKSK